MRVESKYNRYCSLSRRELGSWCAGLRALTKQVGLEDREGLDQLIQITRAGRITSKVVDVHDRMTAKYGVQPFQRGAPTSGWNSKRGETREEFVAQQLHGVRVSAPGSRDEITELLDLVESMNNEIIALTKRVSGLEGKRDVR